MIVKVGSADRLTIDGLGKVGLGVNSSESPNAAFEVRGSLNENSHAIRITNLGHGLIPLQRWNLQVMIIVVVVNLCWVVYEVP